MAQLVISFIGSDPNSDNTQMQANLDGVAITDEINLVLPTGADIENVIEIGDSSYIIKPNATITLEVEEMTE